MGTGESKRVIHPFAWVCIIAGGVVAGLFLYSFSTYTADKGLKAWENHKYEARIAGIHEESDAWSKIIPAGIETGKLKLTVETNPEYTRRMKKIGQVAMRKELKEHLESHRSVITDLL